MHRTLYLLLIMAPFVVAQDIWVAPGGSIQSAINQANTGNRVLVQAGSYTEQIDFLGKAIDVIGIAGASQTTIDAAGQSPVVRFGSAEGPASRLRGFTITGGVAPFGAGGIVATSGATPTIEDCIIRNNVGKFGGGVSGAAILRRCSIINNHASVSHGGGLYGAPQLSYCVVAGNTCSSGSGGGLYLLGGSVIIESCIFADNRCIFGGAKGGGLYIKSNAAAVIRHSVLISNSTSAGNFNALGGALAVEAAGTSVENCTLMGNTLSGNTKLGGAIWGPATVKNSIVRDNTLPQLSGVLSGTYCDIEGGFSGLGNFDLDPQLVSLLGRDYHLNAGSPCIDAGDPLILDPDGTPSDVGAFRFQTLYTRSNTRVSDWSAPSWPELSSVVGGRVVLQILGSTADAHQGFAVLGSVSGTTPGFSLFGQIVPLNFDPYTSYTIANPNNGLLANSLGTLDASGRAQTVLTLPPSVQGVSAPLSAHHAALVAGTPTIGLVTNAEALVIVP